MFCKEILIILIIFYTVAADESSQCPNIITRSQWGAKPAKNINYLILPISYVIIHATSPTPETRTCMQLSECTRQVAIAQEFQMDITDADDIIFSFLIGGDGNVYEGTGWVREGDHTFGYNRKSIAIAFIGSYQVHNASQMMLDAAHQLIVCGKAQGILRSTVRVISSHQVSSSTISAPVLFNQIRAWPEWASTLP